MPCRSSRWETRQRSRPFSRNTVRSKCISPTEAGRATENRGPDESGPDSIDSYHLRNVACAFHIICAAEDDQRLTGLNHPRVVGVVDEARGVSRANRGNQQFVLRAQWNIF